MHSARILGFSSWGCKEPSHWGLVLHVGAAADALVSFQHPDLQLLAFVTLSQGFLAFSSCLHWGHPSGNARETPQEDSGYKFLASLYMGKPVLGSALQGRSPSCDLLDSSPLVVNVASLSPFLELSGVPPNNGN